MRAASLVVASGLLAASTPAGADHASYHLTASGDVAATDNVFAAASGDQQADVFFQLRPGLLIAYDAPRMIHDLTVEVELLDYAKHSDSPSVTYHGGWRGLFLPGPRSEAVLAANASTGVLNALNTGAPANQTPVIVLPSGSVDVRQGDASGFLTYTAGQATHIAGNVVGRYTQTDDHVGNVVTSQTVDANLDFEHDFRGDSLGVQLGGTYLNLETLVPMGTLMPNRLDQQLNPTGYLQWRHDINKQWSANVDGGVILVHPVGHDPYNPKAVRHGGTYPVADVGLAYSEAWGRASIIARRIVAPNLLIAQNTVTTGVVSQLALPLPWLADSRRRDPKLFALATLGVERTQLIDADTGGTTGNFYVSRADISVGWSPVPNQTYGIRFEYIHQTGDPVAAVPLIEFTRDTLYFTFALRFPDRVAGDVPKETKSARADRGDQAPVGEEPVVPDGSDSSADTGDK